MLFCDELSSSLLRTVRFANLLGLGVGDAQMSFRLRAAALACGIFFLQSAQAETGVLGRAVGGFKFEEAAKESPLTRNFNNGDGRLRFAIITHTAGNGFYDPTYVGAKAAADLIGAELVMLGSEAPVDDVPRQIEILNQIIRDPAIDGIITTTPQFGAYDDIIKEARKRGIRIATINTYDASLLERDTISHTGQDPEVAALAGEALSRCLMEKKVRGGTIIFPNTTTLGNQTVNRRVTVAFEATIKALHIAGRLNDFTVDAGPRNIGIDVSSSDPVGAIRSLIESRGDVVGAFGPSNFITPAIGTAIAQTKKVGHVCAYGFELSSATRELISSGALQGSIGQQPFLQGFWPVMQLYLEIDRGIAATHLDTRAQVVTKENVGQIGTRYEN
jgi:simple sugar transport system substrate-binding protein